MRRKEKNTPRACPACNKVLSSRLHLCSTNNDDSNITSETLNPNSLTADNILSSLDPHINLLALSRESTTDTSNAQVSQLSNPSASIVKTCFNENTNFYNDIKHHQLQSQQSNAESTSLLLSNIGSSPKPVYRSNLSLASLSLRASNLTIDSERNATSSV